MSERLCLGVDAGVASVAGAARCSVPLPPPSPEAVASESSTCYEVSDEEFDRLMQAGALEMLPGADGADGQVAEFFEISEEEFERLLQAGELHPTQERASPSDADWGPAEDCDVPDHFERASEGALAQEGSVACGSDVAIAPDGRKGRSGRSSQSAQPQSSAQPAQRQRQSQQSRQERHHEQPARQARRPRSVDCALITKAKGRRERHGAATGGGLFFLPMDGAVSSASAAPPSRGGSPADVDPSYARASGSTGPAAGAPLRSARMLRELRPAADSSRAPSSLSSASSSSRGSLEESAAQGKVGEGVVHKGGAADIGKNTVSLRILGVVFCPTLRVRSLISIVPGCVPRGALHPKRRRPWCRRILKFPMS